MEFYHSISMTQSCIPHSMTSNYWQQAGKKFTKLSCPFRWRKPLRW